MNFSDSVCHLGWQRHVTVCDIMYWTLFLIRYLFKSLNHELPLVLLFIHIGSCDLTVIYHLTSYIRQLSVWWSREFHMFYICLCGFLLQTMLVDDLETLNCPWWECMCVQTALCIPTPQIVFLDHSYWGLIDKLILNNVPYETLHIFLTSLIGEDSPWKKLQP